MRPYPAVLGVAVLAAAAAAAPVQGQALSLGPAIEGYRFADHQAVGIRSVTLLSTPFGADATVAGPLSVQLRGAFAHGRLTRSDESTATLSGLTDTDLRLVARFAQDRASVMAIVLVPTGAATHTAAESEIASLVSADLLPFRVSYWGAGGGAGIGADYHAEFGDLGVRAGASYLVAREFEPLAEDRFGYRPGNQVSASLAMEQRVGTAGRLRLQALMQRYDDDALDGARLYSPGNRVQAIGSYAFVLGDASSAIVYGGGMHRGGGNALHALASDAPDQSLFLAGGGLRLALGSAVLLPSVDARAFRTDDGVGQGWLGGTGLAIELGLGALTLTPAVHGRFGNVIVRDGQESDITGFSLALGARLNAGRP